MPMKRKILVALFLFLHMLILSGCWSNKELTDLAFVIAIGFDKSEDGKIVGTFQIVNPSNVAGGLQGGTMGDASAVTVYTSTGKNVYEVTRQASSKLSRILYYSHANLLVIGEQLAKEEGLYRVLDTLDRDIQFRNTAKVVIAHETKAEDILKVTTPVDKIPANKIMKTLKFSEELWGGHVTVNIRDVLESLSLPGKETIIPVFKVRGSLKEGKNISNLQNTEPKATLSADGLAIFKEDKMIDWVDTRKARGIVWTLDKIKETNVPVDWGDKKDAITYQVLREKTKVTTDFSNGNPVISIRIQVKGNVGEVDVPINLKDLNVRNKINEKVEKRIKEQVHASLKHAQSKKADIFGFGENIYRNHPQAWDRLKKDWNEEHFPELKVKVTVDAAIVRTGLKNSPYLYQMKNNSE
ncbi:MAG TPA: Ger(x)C family spore germination protein [Bacillus bacterium]|uniref:Spore germination protein KC n=1 Tax=Siminovitchia fordii TaxID=254759 RepID=A0ABQ4K682_9BACI|nr:Ger(x)C family spore germination protein [Siminovitchia fordii]GIN20700.1 spore germination protein KC [Siminovitchia fordii]HBZ08709.1 Ger(x)C family spore germination protein [Bacillus sp. (in: firmicutes)]